MSDPILLLSRSDVDAVLSPAACIAAVEEAFLQLAEGRTSAPGILGMHAQEGSFHVKAAFLALDRPYFAAKLNANFPRNALRHGMPTIQGAVVLFDAANGTPLAIMDSASITALRTAAATAIAARHLAPADCDTVAICGCGAQAVAQLRALRHVRTPRRVLAHDVDAERAAAFARAMESELGLPVVAVSDVASAIAASRLVVTCTTARRFFVMRDMVAPGTFIAAVGADHEEKQEIEPALMAAAKVVTDLTAQAVAIGDLHHAIVSGAMTAADVHAELGDVVSGRKPGRERDDETIVFDSTGTGLQDVAAAIAAYRGALARGSVRRFALAEDTREAVTSR
jgi:ornithine cyclodeaminase/alanine dehydrogenase-like protein (mu-crystallin family)